MIPTEVTQYTDKSLSAIHHALRTPRRRLLVGFLLHRVITSNDEPWVQSTDTACESPVPQLAREIVAIEENVSLEQATGDTYRSVYTALIQTHLPKLDDLGAVEFDEDRKIVRPDTNLVAIGMVAAISSPIAQALFHDGVSRHDLGGPEKSLQEETS
jgi:hypothetical protein